MHYREAGRPGNPAVVLLHGFPELSYSWRKVMQPLADAGYHVIAPDHRGYGETTGFDDRYDGDLSQYRMLNLVADAAHLLHNLGIGKAHVVGHDFGSPVAAYLSLTRPEMVRSCVLMSAPFGGVPIGGRAGNVHEELAKLGRKHYQWYYSTREADADMRHAPQGLHAFLRAYYHMKSADWTANKPFPLASNAASEQAKLPRYYVMDLNKGMAEQVASEMPTAAQIAACKWLTDEELKVYASEYGRNGFQGGLQSYRVGRAAQLSAELRLFAGRTIDVPSLFLSGKSDWGVYQRAGSLEGMKRACTKFEGVELVDGAGHWVQQEQSAKVADRLVTFARQHS
jgi:pimeloyl-ACP methyl ester carboxylesterase